MIPFLKVAIYLMTNWIWINMLALFQFRIWAIQLLKNNYPSQKKHLWQSSLCVRGKIIRDKKCIANISNQNTALTFRNNSAGYIDLNIKGIRSYVFLDLCVPLVPLEMGRMGSTLPDFPSLQGNICMATTKHLYSFSTVKNNKFLTPFNPNSYSAMLKKISSIIIAGMLFQTYY